MPMPNQFTHYASTDTGAPTLSNSTPGSLIAILDAILVNGYGSKIAAGWSKAFSGTNLAAYRAPNGLRHYFRVDDTASTTYGALLVGYETMSDVNTGTGQFPTSAQTINSGIPKGQTSTVWHAFADARTCLFFSKGYSAAPGGPGTGYAGSYFGEGYMVQTSDSYGSLIKAHNTTVGVAYLSDTLSTIATSIAAASFAWMPRAYTGLGTSIQVSITGDGAKSGSAGYLQGIIPGPNPEDGGLYLSPLWISDPSTSPVNNIRGRVRGLWHCLHPNTAIPDLTTFTGLGDLAGKTFLSLSPAGNNTSTPFNTACFIIETSATLETN